MLLFLLCLVLFVGYFSVVDGDLSVCGSADEDAKQNNEEENNEIGSREVRDLFSGPGNRYRLTCSR